MTKLYEIKLNIYRLIPNYTLAIFTKEKGQRTKQTSFKTGVLWPIHDLDVSLTLKPMDYQRAFNATEKQFSNPTAAQCTRIFNGLLPQLKLRCPTCFIKPKGSVSQHASIHRHTQASKKGIFRKPAYFKSLAGERADNTDEFLKKKTGIISAEFRDMGLTSS